MLLHLPPLPRLYCHLLLRRLVSFVLLLAGQLELLAMPQEVESVSAVELECWEGPRKDCPK
jgi:hypothetical protein